MKNQGQTKSRKKISTDHQKISGELEQASNFTPKIIGFLCNWCSYAGADLAGVSRFQYSPNIRIIRIMCSGRIDPSFILEMFLQGTDGVFIGGCHLGDCHYQRGNYFAKKRIKVTQLILERAGLNPDRLRLEWISASEGKTFAETITDFTKQIHSLGPSPVAGAAPDMEILENLFVARNVTDDYRLRLLVNKGEAILDSGNSYSEKVDPEFLDDLIVKVIDDEFIRSKILFILSVGPLSVPEISVKTKVAPDIILQHIVTLKDRDLIRLESIDDFTPLYGAKELPTESGEDSILDDKTSGVFRI